MRTIESLTQAQFNYCVLRTLRKLKNSHAICSLWINYLKNLQ